MSAYIFQALDWWAKDINIYNEDEEDNDLEDNYIDFENMKFDLQHRKHIIKIFGRTEDGKSIGVSVVDFKPFFFIKLEDITIIEKDNEEQPTHAFINYKDKQKKCKIVKIVDRVRQEIITNLDPQNQLIYQDIITDQTGIEYLISKDMWGFNGRKKDIFIKICCNNLIAMKMIEKKIRNNANHYGLYKDKKKLKIYEANIEPMLRFIHLQQLNTTGWISIKKNTVLSKLEAFKYDKIKSCCNVDVDICVSWKNVLPIKNSQIAPFKILSWDIECSSSHGDFPVPIKNYMKLSRDLIAYSNKLNRENATNRIELILTQIHNAFINGYHNKNLDCEIGYLYPKVNNATDKLLTIKDENNDSNYKSKRLIKLLEQHIIDIINMLDGKVIYPQLLSIEKQKDIALYKAMHNKNNDDDDFDHGVQNDENNINNDSDDEGEYTTKRDERIDQLIHKFGLIFPKLEGDPIIQIGMVIEKFGDLNYDKIMLNMKGCDDIEDVKVYAFDDEDIKENERKLIKKFVSIINKNDIDIITGFNIFGFDYQYLYDRAKELNCTDYLSKLSKFNHIKSTYQVKELSSSALGHNELKYIEANGRVLIDIMKIVQRDHKLDSYKLDFISSTFMNGKIKKVLEVKEIMVKNEVEITLQLDNILGISHDNYIKITDIKYFVKSVNSNTSQIVITLKPNGETMDEIYNLFEGKKWGLAKDDVTPKDIFECYKGTDTQRAHVAKYCIQDCSLCNHLMNKLKIIPQNFGMAAVCNVPLSYIIMRGQGIKVFSLISKICHYEGYRIPVIKKIDEEDSYEGAIVLVPTPGIYTEQPVAVNDYASLYPSSMISENISHDSLVLDEEKYGNLPGYNYVEIEYDIYKFEIKGKQKNKIKTGETKICRYAQFVDKNGNRDIGIIPKTLQKLLAARKNTRKQILEKTFTMNNGNIVKGIIDSESETTITIKLLDETILDNGQRYSTKMELAKSDIEKQIDSFNEFERAVLDGLQLAYKVTANSVYGQVGARTSNIYLKELAASTTATGRNLLLEAKKYAEEKYQAQIVYGDSVPFDEPIVIKYPDERIDVKAISDIVEEEKWKEFTQYKNPEFVTTIRSMLVSIILDGVADKYQFDEFTEIIPKWIRKKTIENRFATKNINNKWTWELNKNETQEQKLNHINKLCDMFIESTNNRTDKFQANPDIQVWTDNGWQKVFRLIKHKTNKKMFRISTDNGIVDVTEDHSLCSKDLFPIKPNELEIGKTELLHHPIDTSLFKEFSPIVPAYPSEFYGKSISDKQKFVDISDELYTCSQCNKQYDRSMYYWDKNKYSKGEKKRTAQCKLCVKKQKCVQKEKEFNGQLNKTHLDVVMPAYTLTKDEAWVWGLFMGDGSNDRYEYCSGLKYSWEINNQDLHRLNHAKEILEAIEAHGIGFKILDTMESSCVYKLVPTCSLRYMAIKYRIFMYDKFRQKKVPQIILQAPYEIRKAFFDGYYEANGRKESNYIGYTRDENWNNSYKKIDFATKGKSTAQGLYLLAYSIGFKNLNVNRLKDKDRVYRISSYNIENSYSNKHTIKYIEEISMTNVDRDYEDYNIKFHDEFVYDIETTTGRFNGGVGCLVHNNTDSSFNSYPNVLSSNMSDREKLEATIKVAQEFGENFREDILKTCLYRKLNSYIPPEGYPDTPHDFEYEKTFYPFIIFSKKRYVGNLYGTNADKYYQSSMGVVLKRRDNAKIVKHIYGGIIDIIMKDKDINKSLSFLNEELKKLVRGEFPIELLTITKVLNATYAAPERIPQKALADRMKARDPGSAPQINDRVPYVFMKLENESKGIIQAHRVEHPNYVNEHNIPLDYKYYIENQIMKPVLQLYILNITQLQGFPYDPLYFNRLYDKKIKEYTGSSYRGDIRTDTKILELTNQAVEREKLNIAYDILFQPIINLYNELYNIEVPMKKTRAKVSAKEKAKPKAKSRAKIKIELDAFESFPNQLENKQIDDNKSNLILDNKVSSNAKSKSKAKSNAKIKKTFDEIFQEEKNNTIKK